MFQARILFFAHFVLYVQCAYRTNCTYTNTKKKPKKNNRRQYQVDENKNEIFGFLSKLDK